MATTKKIKRTKEDYDMECCVFCGAKWRYNFERELHTTKPNYIMSVWYKDRSFIGKLKSTKHRISKHNQRKYICIDCALQVNKSLMLHIKNFNMQRIEFQKETNK